MADTTGQEKGPQEEQITSGTIHTGVPHQNTSSQQASADTAQTKSRDMATIGGGNIPGGVNTSNNIVEGEGGLSGENVGEEISEEPNSVKNSSEGSDPTATNTVDKGAQSNGGGRHPSQPQTAMGDQDATQGRSGDEITEPMSSRAPDKINQKQK